MTPKSILLVPFLLAVCSGALAQSPSFTTGFAKTTQASLIDCGSGSRVSAVGQITAEDGTVWVVPAQTHFQSAPKAADLFNECGGPQLGSLAELDLAKVPLMDAGGSEEFVAYVFADNYFELYVNGHLVAVDPVPFTPFNTNVVRFKAKRPVTLAVMAVDWEESLGLGVENNRGKRFHPGDGGFVAVIKDAKQKVVAVTDESWRAQTFYTAPLKTRSCLVVTGQQRNSSACNTDGADDTTGYSAAHWAVPTDWMQTGFNDAIWPMASTYSNDTVGVDNKKAYTNFADVFDANGADAQFIWSTNLVLDNLVLLRKTFQ